MERKTFLGLISLLAETFGRKTTEALIEGYWIALRDLEQSDFVCAVESLLGNARFMPVPAQIREAAREAARTRADSLRRLDAPLLDPREDLELSALIRGVARKWRMDDLPNTQNDVQP